MRFATALVLFAHPDDAEYMCGGTVARWAAEGTAVHYVVITDGSAGDNRPGAVRAETAVVREREQRAAAEVLGVRSVTFLGFRDGELEVNLATRRAACREVRRLRPDVVVAPDPRRWWSGTGYVNHADHRAAGELAMCAVMPDAPTRPQFPELLDEGLEPFAVANLWIGTEDADTHVDITATLETKLAALARHESQGGADAATWVRQRAHDVGAPVGLEAAEGFRAFVLRAPEEEED